MYSKVSGCSGALRPQHRMCLATSNCTAYGNGSGKRAAVKNHETPKYLPSIFCRCSLLQVVGEFPRGRQHVDTFIDFDKVCS